mmetsp:Transcript_15944/g.18007  ORF Transcript_15944/g.18007 Transcript_15944/m.18007 type:complete len:189 (+) Transcript_15944:188-754(+)|eukprot:CAMPEP_0184073166 /NCGR_PEP_ID=MMETSP0957-20130417/63040_1 /TAXON_ID=627963 /ORGANISM="Aplanochytrium sp, Strain PBS07" /LENGTH=188 /DNA_ID=CAMNT_0026374617 /DNA_START=114 /DNA_END=680 /DNA_ORIENTATION=+
MEIYTQAQENQTVLGPSRHGFSKQKSKSIADPRQSKTIGNRRQRKALGDISNNAGGKAFTSLKNLKNVQPQSKSAVKKRSTFVPRVENFEIDTCTRTNDFQDPGFVDDKVDVAKLVANVAQKLRVHQDKSVSMEPKKRSQKFVAAIEPKPERKNDFDFAGLSSTMTEENFDLDLDLDLDIDLDIDLDM